MRAIAINLGQLNRFAKIVPIVIFGLLACGCYERYEVEGVKLHVNPSQRDWSGKYCAIPRGISEDGLEDSLKIYGDDKKIIKPDAFTLSFDGNDNLEIDFMKESQSIKKRQIKCEKYGNGIQLELSHHFVWNWFFPGAIEYRHLLYLTDEKSLVEVNSNEKLNGYYIYPFLFSPNQNADVNRLYKRVDN